jgi:hypothetical protein
MWRPTKGRQIAWYVFGFVATMLWIGGARQAISQSRAEESSRNITLPQLNAPLDQSISESISVGGVTRTYRLFPHI